MTTEQIHKNLATIANTWPGGVPEQQVDQVRALKAELKRRGVDQHEMRVAANEPKPLEVSEMNADQLSAELQRLSQHIGTHPHDEEAQNRFADVRYALRAKSNKPAASMTSPPRTLRVEKLEDTIQPGDVRVLTAEGFQHPEGGLFDEASKAAEKLGNSFTGDQLQKEMGKTRASGRQDFEAMMRKVNVATIASNVAARLLANQDYGDINGDSVDEATTVAVAVAEAIFTKLGL